VEYVSATASGLEKAVSINSVLTTVAILMGSVKMMDVIVLRAGVSI